MGRQFDKMVCLVGENPLPVYLGIRQFASKDATVVFVCSETTEPVAKRISDQLAKEVRMGAHQITTVRPLKCDPFKPTSVIDVLKSLGDISDYALNYTGGTKVMSAFSVLHWKDKRDQAFYLEETDSQFHFEKGTPLQLDVQYWPKLQTFCTLHGVVPKGGKPYPTDSEDDTKSLWNHLGEMGRYHRIAEKSEFEKYRWLKDQWTDDGWAKDGDWAKFLSFLPASGESWSNVAPPANYQRDVRNGKTDAFYQWNKLSHSPCCSHTTCEQLSFAMGTWLELLTRHVITSISNSTTTIKFGIVPVDPLVCTEEVTSAQEFTIAGSLFESDIIFSAGRHFFYVSVTTSESFKKCKMKMFEAIHRARQIGGGLARVAVVCLAKGDPKDLSKDENQLAALNASIGTKDRHVFFGKHDVSEWMKEPMGDVTRFREFLLQ